MAALTITPVADTGLADVLYVAAAASQTVDGGVRAGGWEPGLVVLLVNNGSGGSINVTLGAAAAVPVAAGKTGAFPIYREGVGDNTVAITYSATTTVTVAAVRFGA